MVKTCVCLWQGRTPAGSLAVTVSQGDIYLVRAARQVCKVAVR